MTATAFESLAEFARTTQPYGNAEMDAILAPDASEPPVLSEAERWMVARRAIRWMHIAFHSAQAGHHKMAAKYEAHAIEEMARLGWTGAA